MKLLELDPHWFVLEENGPVVGLSFECPHCRRTRLGVLFHLDAASKVSEDAYLGRHGNDPERQVWQLLGQQDFATLTLAPSIDASHLGHWHGFITNGEIR